jgi:pimeloyl-ACP methyl ester carboxylesterase
MKATAIPRLDRTIELADGRTLAFSEWGVPDGKPLVFLHGVPGSRLMCPDLDATEAAGVRLITIDRPGYGRSDLQPDRTRLNWVEDYLQLIDHLELDTCPVVGMSGGGPYALACAYRSPDRVPAIGLGGSLALIDQAPGYRSPCRLTISAISRSFTGIAWPGSRHSARRPPGTTATAGRPCW